MLLFKTGINEGAAYNALGTNITEFPTGQMNRTVGRYFYDFAACSGLAEMRSNEFSFIISDGRLMTRNSADGLDVILDNFDKDEEDTDTEDQKGLDRRGYSTHVTALYATFRFQAATFTDVDVLTTLVADDADVSGGTPNGYLDPVQEDTNLYVWLDNQVVSPGEVGDIEVLAGIRHQLRYSLHAALYKVPLVSDQGEAVDDDLEQAGLGPGGEYIGAGLPETPLEKVPGAGPNGLMFALGGGEDFDTTTNSYEWPENEWVALYDPVATVPYIRHTTIPNIPYASAYEDAVQDVGVVADSNPNITYEFDATEGDQAYDSLGFELSRPDTRQAGKELVLRIKWDKLNVHVGPDEMLILHIQTGRARLRAAPYGNATLASTPGLIIARGTPAHGPELALVHHQVNARGRNRPLR